jgi:hypothetical protein
VWAVLGVFADFLIVVPRIGQEDPEAVAYSLGGRLIQLAIYALILSYLFKRNVLAYFRLRSLRVDRALFPLVVLSVIVLTVTYFISTQLASTF